MNSNRTDDGRPDCTGGAILGLLDVLFGIRSECLRCQRWTRKGSRYYCRSCRICWALLDSGGQP